MGGSRREGQRPPVFLLCLLFGMAALSGARLSRGASPDLSEFAHLDFIIPPHVHCLASRLTQLPMRLEFSVVFSLISLFFSFHFSFSALSISSCDRWQERQAVITDDLVKLVQAWSHSTLFYNVSQKYSTFPPFVTTTNFRMFNLDFML